MKITLVALTNPNNVNALFSAFNSHFHDLPNVEVKNDSILANRADAIVSPANSYGWMGGGIDLIYRNEFGMEIQHKVQQAIIDRHNNGELPVGEAVVIPTGSPMIPYLISAPTMRIPGPVPNTQNAYLAFKAALTEAKKAGFEHILCSGLCTQTGRMDPNEAAKQMRQAYDEVLGGQ
ncbi:Appr-1-p processing protein [Burkholderia multivorans]|uniref:macro domain-containing protein n=1 Tax=Burkholderia multivorans TaxID=87883 RepID=UPI000DAE1213|nr:macro domain-containing protein [Burkholderia multivorans]RAA28771.1 Appr-1-p processing protein [Burkholderia multivorans]RAA32987.1 Appr-1-p processing protein [Burkholderia multivorans]RAA33341.1 Appr-1-p processing protein [Burkholderia multivorans]RAA47996.1 Appr-1-p processing protein [Burkholderia multivorans]RAA50488.1 Appr-1-p processing protein [Burkholderia multivorans]